jgi:molybdopterin-guanine dinucleotide biosynthesis protein A
LPVLRNRESTRAGILRSVRDTIGSRGRLNVSALIFAGGRATRLGGVNKALLEIGGTPIIGRILSAVQQLADETVLLTNDSALASRAEFRLVFDPAPHAGVLPALAAGLAAASNAVCLTVACDMPFVSAALFERLLKIQADADADVVIPRTAGYLEPMHAVYRRDTVLAAIRSALERGEQRMISYFRDVHVHEVDETDWRQLDPRGLAFFNVNTPEDLAEAQRLAGSLG